MMSLRTHAMHGRNPGNAIRKGDGRPPVPSRGQVPQATVEKRLRSGQQTCIAGDNQADIDSLQSVMNAHPVLRQAGTGSMSPRWLAAFQRHLRQLTSTLLSAGLSRCSQRIVVTLSASLLLATLTFSQLADAAGRARLVKNINGVSIPSSSLCGNPVSSGGVAYFCAAFDQLWMSDGTAAGTKPVRRANGLNVQGASGLTIAGTGLFYVVRNELWRTDGTPKGTGKVIDADDRVVSSPALMTAVNDQLLFFRFSAERRYELWTTDGTPQGTRRVYRFDSRIDPNDTVAIDGNLYFTNYEHELWKSDGTPAGTVRLKDIDGRNISDERNNLTDVAGTLFFSMENGRQRDLWKSDGTPQGTVLVKAAVSAPNFRVANFKNVAGALFFTAEFNYTDTQIWRSDGTAAGTASIVTLAGATQFSASAATVGDLYLLASQQRGLWSSDGTFSGTVQIAQDLIQFTPPPLTQHDGSVYFAAQNGSGLGVELWSTDGTQAGTRLVRDIHWGVASSTPRRLASTSLGLIFEADRGRKFGGPALWLSDGTRSGTQQVKDISLFNYGSFPSLGRVVGDNVYFLASMGRQWRSTWQLWKSDGTRAGTQSVLDLLDEQSSPGQSYHNEFADLEAVDSELYVSGRDAQGWGLWRVGALPGYESLPDVVPSPAQPLTDLTEFQHELFFFSDSAASTRGLWRLSPGQTSAVLLRDGLIEPKNMAAVSDRLVFTSNGDQLWMSDGSPAGTVSIASLGLGPDTQIDQVQAFGDRFIFRARWLFNPWGRTNRTALWISDGTAAGTFKLRRPYPWELVVSNKGILYATGGGLWLSHGATGGAMLAPLQGARGFVKVGATVFFAAGPDQELWKTDATAAGTVRVAGGFRVHDLAKVNGGLYFTAADPDTGAASLWRSDGTGPGTVVVKPGMTQLRGLEFSGNRFFAAMQDEPMQLWMSDGTAAGTRRLSAFQPSSRIGPFFDEPFEFRIGNTLMFVIDDGIRGAEPWAIDLD